MCEKHGVEMKRVCGEMGCGMCFADKMQDEHWAGNGKQQPKTFEVAGSLNGRKVWVVDGVEM